MPAGPAGIPCGYPVIENEYRNGGSQRLVQATNSRKQRRLAKRLAAAQLQFLRDFYEARNGPSEPFYLTTAIKTHSQTTDSAGQRQVSPAVDLVGQVVEASATLANSAVISSI